MKVAVLGTGLMGAGMARSLLRDGHQVSVWNRTAAKARPLADDGAVVAPTAAVAVGGAEAVLLMLFDQAAVLQVMQDASGAAGPDTVWVQAGTIGLDGTARVAEAAGRLNLKLLDSPVLGTRKPAADGTLVVLASGDPDLREQVDPVLSSIGSRTVWVGHRLGDASALKLVCNSWVASITGAVGQAVALARALGLDPQLFLDAIQGGATDSPYAHVKGAAMVSGDFPPSFALNGVLKDLELIRAAGQSHGVDTALLDGLQSVFQKAADAGHGDEDMAAVVTGFRVGRSGSAASGG